ncbi:ATP/GTP-binding protein [Streptomyces viridosporus ATCC 14672]|uniref:ATP/GTP-binding protein n=1 Tax=Streptomyces viridosporus (strain ATCC 14672 / DSM 40746 / JCM 4963 / KCTC 9882 / NRRL B-12104 / FH 1290) TaxID=566461 RepID=D5ZR61_STRV1|nr:ATP/GTP-binding protein [Streptomyces viridosporus ATCC 14672]
MPWAGWPGVGAGGRGSLHRHQRGVLAPLQDLVEAHHRAAPARLVADVDVVGQLLDETQAPAVLRVGRHGAGRRAGGARGAGGEAGARVGDLDAALLAVEVGGHPVRLRTAAPRGVPAVLDGVRARLAEGDGEVVGDVGVDARGLHGAEQQAPGERHARGIAPQME